MVILTVLDACDSFFLEMWVEDQGCYFPDFCEVSVTTLMGILKKLRRRTAATMLL
jgi:hypothetical protein